MFCSNCGVRISHKSNRCPNCGAPAPAEEYCGGFWGLVNESGSRIDERTYDMANYNTTYEQMENNYSKRETRNVAMYKRNSKIFLIASVVLLLIALVEMALIVLFFMDFGKESDFAENTDEYVYVTDDTEGSTESTSSETEETSAEETSESLSESSEDVSNQENNGIFQNDRKEEINKFKENTENETVE